MASLPYPRTPLSPRLYPSFPTLAPLFLPLHALLFLFHPISFPLHTPYFCHPHRPTQMLVSTDADIRTDRRRHPHRPTQTSAPTDADARIDRRGCSYRPTRMTFVDVSQCQTFTFVLPNRCFCGSRPPFLHFTRSFSFHIFLCFPRSVVLSCCVHPLVAVLKTVSRAYNNIMCASTMRCFNCKQLLKRVQIFNFSLQKFWWFAKKLYLCIRFRTATVSQANVRDAERNGKRTETRVL